VRCQVRWFVEQLLEEELEAALGRGRYERVADTSGRRHGHRPRQLVTTFGPLTLSVPRARLAAAAGEREWSSTLLPAYRRLSRRAELLIAEAYLTGVNTRRVRRALQTLFAGHVGKDAVSRAWRKTRAAWKAWQQRDLAGENIVRLILDGTVVRARLDRKATAISLLIALGVRRDGQKVVPQPAPLRADFGGSPDRTGLGGRSWAPGEPWEPGPRDRRTSRVRRTPPAGRTRERPSVALPNGCCRV
jgi:transposase-like protein